MKKYTVLLLYPDYLSSTVETYLAHVESVNVESAIHEAQLCAAEENDFTEDDDPVDFAPLFVAEGHLEDIK